MKIIPKTLKLSAIENCKKFHEAKSKPEIKSNNVYVPTLKADYDTHISIKFNPIHFFRHREPDYYIGKPVTIIDELISFEKGAGTKAIKEIVRKSLSDISQGRVALLASNINYKKGHPMGFYYKLGFRSINEKYNKICENWLKNGGRLEDRPTEIKWGLFTPPEMYLPRENIEHCLNYPEKGMKLSLNA